MKTSYSSDTVMYFVAGLAAGTTVAMLFAPYAGEATRMQIKDGVQKGMNSVNTAVEAGKKRAAQHARRVQNAIQAGRDAYKNAYEMHADQASAEG